MPEYVSIEMYIIYYYLSFLSLLCIRASALQQLNIYVNLFANLFWGT